MKNKAPNVGKRTNEELSAMIEILVKRIEALEIQVEEIEYRAKMTDSQEE